MWHCSSLEFRQSHTGRLTRCSGSWLFSTLRLLPTSFFFQVKPVQSIKVGKGIFLLLKRNNFIVSSVSGFVPAQWPRSFVSPALTLRSASTFCWRTLLMVEASYSSLEWFLSRLFFNPLEEVQNWVFLFWLNYLVIRQQSSHFSNLKLL